jgi:hypothetical protein
MRKFLIAACALTVSVPAAAQPSGSWDVEGAIESIDFDRAARVLERVVGAVMDIPVGGIAAAVDPLGRRGGIYPTDTIGSVMHRNDPESGQRIRDTIRGSARQMEAAGRAVGRMMPVLHDSYDRMRAAIAEAIAGMSPD